MGIHVSPELEVRVQQQIRSGRFSTEEDVIRAAMDALIEQQEAMASIQAGLDDAEAGRYKSFCQVDAEMRAKHNIPRQS